MMPVASGVRFNVCTVFMVPPTVAVTIFPPWKALAALIWICLPAAMMVWQVTHASVASYLPLVAPAAEPAAGSIVGSTGAHWATLGCMSKGAGFGATVWLTPWTVRR